MIGLTLLLAIDEDAEGLDPATETAAVLTT